jgi:hypothetical protein
MKLFLYVLCMASALMVHGAPVIIVIHGTWAAHSAWYRPGGDFFDALCASAQQHGMKVVPFMWSGKNSDKERANAARSLAQLIMSYDAVICVAHSHGVNVTMLASQYIAKKVQDAYAIEAVYAFGCPVRQSDYFPATSVIRYMYNFFSFEDLVQPIGGASAREFYGFERVANIRVTVEGAQPGHSALHDPIIARWLPFLHGKLHALLAEKRTRELFFERPSLLHFMRDAVPRYEYDGDRVCLLERDGVINQMLMQAFCRGHQLSV